MDYLSNFLETSGMPIVAVFFLGFFLGIVFWNAIRGILPKVLFFAFIFSIVTYGSSSSTIKSFFDKMDIKEKTNDIKEYVNTQISK